MRGRSKLGGAVFGDMSVVQSSSKPVSQWSDHELQTALVTLDGTQVPVTPTTRPMLEKRVQKLLSRRQQAENEDVGERRNRAEFEVDSSREDHHTKNEKQSSIEGYYGVVVNTEGTASTTAQSLSPFYTTKSEALRAIKNIPGARFKKFTNQASAEAFSNSPGNSTPNSTGKQSSVSEKSASALITESKPNQFPSLKTQDLNVFRGVVESGDVSLFTQTVWSNPRYLVNCYSDAPEILHPTSRYNALHCAVRAGKLEICKELMSTLQNPDFWSLVYPNDSPDSVLQRRTHLLDLYLNMQDKAAGETPLHFACKLGHFEIVKLLLSQPSLDTTITNKYKKTAADIVCQNAVTSSTRDKISDLMNAPPIYYVPVLRAADNCTPPQLTPPCTIAEFDQRQGALTDDRGTPLIGQAFAGPMSPAQAEEFYREWRSPSSTRDRRETLQIKRTDSNRGFERVGRQLASHREVGWQEYWEILGCYCDLHKSDGLEKLEHYLASLTTPPRPHQQPDRVSGSLTSPLDTKTGMNESSNISRELFPRDECGVEQAARRRVTCTEQEGGRSLGVDVGEEGKNECGDMTVERARVNGEMGDRMSGYDTDLDLVLKAMASLTISGRKDEGERGDEGEREGGGERRNRKNVETISDAMTKSKCVVGNSPPLPTSQPTFSMETEQLNSSAQSVNTDRVPGSVEYGGSAGSNILGGGKRNTFLLGDVPTKMDQDVYLAVTGAQNLNATLYPHVVEWMDRIKSYSEQDRKSWRTPRPHYSLHGSGGSRRGGSLPVRSPPRSPLSWPPVPPSPLSPSHQLYSRILSPGRHSSLLHRSLNASSTGSTPSRLHHTTPRPRQVLHHTPSSNN